MTITQPTLESAKPPPLYKLTKLNSAILLLLHERFSEREKWTILGIAASISWKSYTENRLGTTLEDMRNSGLIEWSGETYTISALGTRHSARQ